MEAVSRGAQKAVLVDNNRNAAAVIQENISFTKFQSYCNLLTMDAVAALHTLERKYIFDIIFMDPPYDMGLEYPVLEYLSDSTILNDNTLIIIETSLHTDPSAYTLDGKFKLHKIKKYKTNQHIFLHLS